MASFIFPELARGQCAVAVLGVCLAGCAASVPVAPVPRAATPLAQSAVVLAARPLALAGARGAVLLVLAGSPIAAGAVPGGYDVIAQTAEGDLKSCIARSSTPPRPGSTVMLGAGSRCAAADIAGEPAIR